MEILQSLLDLAELVPPDLLEQNPLKFEFKIPFFIEKLIALAICSSIMSLERYIQRAANFPTIAPAIVLVTYGSFMYAAIGIEIGTDRSRLVGEVAGGAAIFCLVLIAREGVELKGLMSALTMWFGSVIGCCIAANMISEAGVMSVLVPTSNLLIFRPIVKKIKLQQAKEEESRWFHLSPKENQHEQKIPALGHHDLTSNTARVKNRLDNN